MARWVVIVFGFLQVCWPAACEDNIYAKHKQESAPTITSFDVLINCNISQISLQLTLFIKQKPCDVRLWDASNTTSYTLMKISPQNGEHLEELRKLQHVPGNVEILKRSRGLNRTTDVLVAPHKRAFLDEFVSRLGIPVLYKLNYGRSFQEALRQPLKNDDYNVFGYNAYEDMLTFINNLTKQFSDVVTVQHMGQSYEGRKMVLVKLSTNPSGSNPIIFIDAGVHAREWAAPAMAMYMIRRLGRSPRAQKRELRGIDWYILPLVNPDGYEFSRTGKSNRLWRKTRSKHTSKNCYGVDGNRNYGFEWGGKGTSKDPCDPEIYAGPKAFSEPETQIVAKIMHTYKDRIKLYVSLHTYGPYMVYPWGFTDYLLPAKWQRLHNLARMVSDSVVRAGGHGFEIMSSGQWYPAAGGSCDYAYGVVGIPYAYTMELTENFEFIFPEELLRIVLPQFFEGFTTFSVQIRREFGKK